ncbi:MAG TPA: multiprotein bridging factor aMBF1 [Methanomassiliicoccaceae archaeon]|nr:multiprotein bridging factor aMBF1 [Methanomassiliicoccaceae archaeon]
MCGKESDYIRTIFLEGAQLKVCKECSRFGEGPEGKGPSKKGKGVAPSRAVVEERLQARERRMRSRDVFKEETVIDLVPDYNKVIREARMARNLKQDELASKVNEKSSVIAQLENGSMRPSDQMIKKLEKELNIKLTEKVALVKPASTKSSRDVLTLGDLIKKK